MSMIAGVELSAKGASSAAVASSNSFSLSLVDLTKTSPNSVLTLK
jgi:hypothetical protein